MAKLPHHECLKEITFYLVNLLGTSLQLTLGKWGLLAHKGQDGREAEAGKEAEYPARQVLEVGKSKGNEKETELLPLARIQRNIQFVCFCLDTDMVIIYLSAGITSKDSSEEDKKATLRVINEENSFLNNSVMILTYALMNGR